jgi:hypothetical protein
VVKRIGLIPTALVLLALVVALSGWGAFALSVHVVRTPGGWVVVPKERLGLSGTFINAAAWGPTDVAENPAVVSRLLATGHAEKLSSVLDPASELDPATQLIRLVTVGR